MNAFAVVHNLTRPLDKPARVRVCMSFGSRLRGLMFQAALGRDDGRLLVGSRDSRLDSAIHMLFVPFDLAVIWVSSGMEVVDSVLARAWHAAYVPSRPARYVLEVHPDLLSDFEIGHKVEIIDA
jgi:uncharacterized membrane protein (UPF0127 family)